MGLREILLDQPDEPPSRIEEALNAPLPQFVWFFGSLAALAVGVLWLVMALGSDSGIAERSVWEVISAFASPAPLLSWIAWQAAGWDDATEIK